MERHEPFFLDRVSNMQAIQQRVTGDFIVRCGHCGVSLAGVLGAGAPVREVIYRHDGDSWFGSFDVSEQPHV